jgi:predicted transcriptional regulator
MTEEARSWHPHLGSLEQEVMDVLWDCPEQLCTRDVLERMTHRLAYTTVATVLGNLVRKGLVERVPHGRSWAYRPRCTRSEYAAAIMAQALPANEDRRGALLRFVETMTPDDLALLRTIVGRRQEAAQDATAPPEQS